MNRSGHQVLGIVSVLSVFCFGTYSLHQLGYGLTYQYTHSLPKGFYLLCPPDQIEKQQLVLFSPTIDKPSSRMKSGRDLLKPVVAVPGEKVCIRDRQVWLGDNLLAAQLDGVNISSSSFCGMLSESQYYVISTHSPKSYDSRYFGPVDRSQIRHKVCS